MTEYDYSPEAYERFMATQHRISRWVDNTERHRREFRARNEVTPPVPPTVPTVHPDDYFGNHRPPPSPARLGHRRHSSSTYPAYGHAAQYASPPITPQNPYPRNSAGPPLPGHMPPFAPPIVSPPRSRESRRSTTTYVVAPPPPVMSPPYYQYPYYASGAYPYMGAAGQGQAAVLPVPANGTPQNTPYYNPHSSQPLRVPPYPSAVNPGINALNPHQLGDVGGAGPLAYSYSTPLPYASNGNSPSAYSRIPQGTSAAMQYLPPHILSQRLHEIGRGRRRSQSTGSSDSGDRGRSRSSESRSRSRGRSRTRKSWWNFT